eukprot:Tbor_TRINITY_DN962_c0_g1::TRINITY_DN962_c0_g1_i1::g.21207::m.21207
MFPESCHHGEGGHKCCENVILTSLHQSKKEMDFLRSLGGMCSRRCTIEDIKGEVNDLKITFMNSLSYLNTSSVGDSQSLPSRAALMSAHDTLIAPPQDKGGTNLRTPESLQEPFSVLLDGLCVIFSSQIPIRSLVSIPPHLVGELLPSLSNMASSTLMTNGSYLRAPSTAESTSADHFPISNETNETLFSECAYSYFVAHCERRLMGDKIDASDVHKLRRSLFELLCVYTVVNRYERSGYQPLHYAARQGMEDVVRLLISYGANIVTQVRPINQSPLFRAISQSHLGVVRVLLEHMSATLGSKDYGGLDKVGPDRIIIWCIIYILRDRYGNTTFREAVRRMEEVCGDDDEDEKCIVTLLTEASQSIIPQIE